MAKGVKKIQCAKGRFYPSMSVQDEKVVIEPDQFVWFKVSEWYPDTTETEKTRDITWIRQEADRNTILRQMTLPSNKMYGLKLPKKLCGPYAYYIEASLFGKRDPADTGLYVSGYSAPKIINSKWSVSNDGQDVRKSKQFAYGETVYLNLETEGLNGHSNLTVEIYNIQSLRSDKRIFTYNRVRVIDGEINLEIRNTSSWQPFVNNIQEEEKFYIKVKDGSGSYIADNNNDTAHARYLRVKNELVSNVPEPPRNLTPVKIGEPDHNAERYEPCKYETINITEVEEKDGKAQQKKVKVFDNGRNLSGIRAVPELISRTVHFNFDQDQILSQSRPDLDNTLRFLLEHEHSTITLNGYACVIGKAEYNRELSLKRSEAIKQYLADGGLDPNRIRSNGKGEILANNNLPDDDKAGNDSIKYKDERQYIEARRVDILFTFYGHDAQTITYETIAPSTDKNLTVDVTGFEAKSCFKNEGSKHQKKIRVTSPEYSSPLEIAGESIQVPVHSALASWNVAPLQYIWPKWNLIEGAAGGGIDSATLYSLYVNSCRYFSNEKNATILIKAYPDIKWELAFELKIDVENYSHTNMPSKYRIFEKHQTVATKEGYKRWLMNKRGEVPIVVGVGLNAEWNNGMRKMSLTKEWERKTEILAKTLSKSVELVQGAINMCRGAMQTASIPVSFGVEYPKFEVVGSWYLQKEEGYSNLAIVGELNFGAKPFIGANVTIDLIAAAVTVASYSTTGSPAISKIVDRIRKAGKTIGAELSVDAKFYGSIEVMFEDFKFNTIKGREHGKLTIGGRMGMRLIAEVKAGNNPWYSKKKPVISFSALARATGDAYFGGEMEIDADDIGLYYQPTLKFSGLEVVLEAEVTVGWFSDSAEVKYTEVVPKKEIIFEKQYLK